MSASNGQLTLDYDIIMVTAEDFRLRSIQVKCRCVIQVDPRYVPPATSMLATTCTHSEQTG